MSFTSIEKFEKNKLQVNKKKVLVYYYNIKDISDFKSKTISKKLTKKKKTNKEIIMRKEEEILENKILKVIKLKYIDYGYPRTNLKTLHSMRLNIKRDITRISYKSNK